MRAVWTLVKRIAGTLAMLLGAVVGTFLLTHIVPANPAQIAAGLNASPAQVRIVREQLGLDKPLLTQLWVFLGELFRGNLGSSFVSQRPVATDIANFFPATLELVLFAMLLTIVIGLPLGVYAALGTTRWVSGLAKVLSFGAMGIPPFIVALLLQIVLFGILGIFPSGSRLASPPPPTVTGLYTVDSILTGRWATLGDTLDHLLLPAAALAICQVGLVVRFVESEVLRIMDADYVRTARSKGVHGARLLFRHVARNVVVPVITLIGLQFGWMLGGTVLVESIFSWPGLGQYILNSIAALDFNPVIFSTLVLAAAFTIINLLVDLAQLVIDPRVRHA